MNLGSQLYDYKTIVSCAKHTVFIEDFVNEYQQDLFDYRSFPVTSLCPSPDTFTLYIFEETGVRATF